MELDGEGGFLRLEAVFRNLSEGLLVVDEKMKFVLANTQAESFLGVKLAELKDKTIKELSSHPSLGPILQLIGSRTKEVFLNREILITLPEQRVLRVDVRPLISLEGAFLGLIISLEDVGKEKLAERLRGEFVLIAAHQLRTPLSNLKWMMKLMLDGDLGPLTDEQKKFLDQGYDSSESMINLINDLLNMARLEEGKFSYKFTPVSMVELVEETIKNVILEATRKHIKIIFEKPMEPQLEVRVDRERIQLVIRNLLDNAIGYTPANGEVTVLVKSDKIFSEVIIKDTGIGIPKNQQARIFERFFRADNAVKTRSEGSGLGLFISRHIVEKHGGKIWFDSEEAKGTIFHFTIPFTLPENVNEAEEGIFT